MSESEMSSGAGMSGCPRWLKVLLLASLAVNLGVAGMVGGRMMREPQKLAAEEPDADGLDRSQARLLRLVPESGRGVARELMLAQRDQIDRHRQRVIDLHRQLAATMRSPQFTEAELRAKLDARRAEMGALFTVLQNQMVQIVANLPPEQRAEMADNLESYSKRWEDRSASR